MGKLDDVIAALEYCNTHEGDVCPDCPGFCDDPVPCSIEGDRLVLGYLKELREVREKLAWVEKDAQVLRQNLYGAQHIVDQLRSQTSALTVERDEARFKVKMLEDDLSGAHEEVHKLTKRLSTNGDLISRSEVLKFPIRRDHYDRENGNPHFINGIETVMEYIENIPTVEAEPVVHARWEWKDLHGDGSRTLCCSNCLNTDVVRVTTKFCSECGARMDEEVAE